MLRAYIIYGLMFLLSFYLIGKTIIESQIPQFIIGLLCIISIWGFIHTIIIIIIYSIILIIENCGQFIRYIKNKIK
jgi:hypothetical protein